MPHAQITEYRSRSLLGGLLRQERISTLDNGDSVLFGRVEAAKGAVSYHQVYTETFRSDSGTVWYYDAQSGGWSSAPLDQMEVGTSCAYIDADGRDYYIQLPVGFTPLENCSLRETGSKGYFTIQKTLLGWRLRVFSPALAPGDVGDYTVVSSEENLLDASDDAAMQRWANYCRDGDGRWCYDGYYFPAPETYVPTGPGVLYRSVAAYFVRSISWQVEIVRCAWDLMPALLDTMRLQQNEEGYFPSMSASTWLQEDYGIPAGYYDTRFNSDLMIIFHEYMKRYGGFENVVNRYFDFYLEFARAHHYETAGGGWLVWDYNRSTSAVHCALNHQLEEILVLYRFGDLLSRPELVRLADRMLLAIEDTRQDWIMEDFNLEYARMADGSYGLQDYPYLTYNDLYYLQKELLAMGRERNETLDALMEAKAKWMTQKGITGYETAPLS